MKAYEYLKQQLTTNNTRNLYTKEGLHICKAMQGKMMSVSIDSLDDGSLIPRRTTGKKTFIDDYSENYINDLCKKLGKKHGDKITMQSLSTSVLENTYCQERRNLDGSICQFCYSDTAVRKDSGMERNLSENTKLLTSQFLDINKLPLITTDFFRFESHGDLNNCIQLINYFLICEKAILMGSKTRFALWTKNTLFLDMVFNGYGIEKPENLTIQVSSPYLNETLEIDDSIKPFVDRVFTVFTDRETSIERGHCLNCCDGIRKHTYCVLCTNCYVSASENGITDTNELLRLK